MLLVGHGTRDPNGTTQFFELVEILRQRIAPVDLEGCLLEFQHPTIEEGWERLVQRGAKAICIAPLLLFAAGHARNDIPEIVDRCAAKTPGVAHQQCGPLSRCPQVIDVLRQRIESVAGDSSPDDSTALVMVGRGSYDVCATADMRVLSEIVAFHAGYANRAVGFYAMAEPRLPGILDQVASDPKIKRVIVQPHLLFQGRLYDSIGQLVDDARQRHPGVEFRLGDYLGPTEQIAGAIAFRALS
ncbi:hypothetical protein CGZ80_02450 [Rhodopirellula sp. MGV]|nr:hypothetical protein CGZ80_02450 [Rhodopirellula sp. MGV]PNY38874.1 sirohydrochlorin chelatase [Rhodopirellula baltica]